MIEEPQQGFAGIVTRAVALAIDALAINAIAFLVVGAINLLVTLLGHHGSVTTVEAIAGGSAWVVWAGAYFVMFWTLTSQTPGARALGIRVLSADGRTLGLGQALVRFGAMALAAVPFGAGFLPVLVDRRRRGVHDLVAGTIVRWSTVADSPRAGEARPLTGGLPSAI